MELLSINFSNYMDIQQSTLDTDMYYLSLTPVAEIEEVPAEGTEPEQPDTDDADEGDDDGDEEEA